MIEQSYEDRFGRLSYLHLAGGGRPVVMLHGWVDNALSCLPLALALKDHDCYLLELPGHGGSDHFVDAQYSLQQYLAPLSGFLNQFDLPVTLVSHSLGAILSMVLTALWPEKVERLVCLDAVLPLIRPADQTLAGLKTAVLADQVRGKKENLRGRTVEQLMVRRSQAEIFIPKDLVQQLMPRLVQPCNGGWCWRFDPRLLLPTALRLTQPQALDIYLSMSRPAMVFYSDFLTPQLNDIAQNPNVSCHYVGDRHHYFHMQPHEGDWLTPLQDFIAHDTSI